MANQRKGKKTQSNHNGQSEKMKKKTKVITMANQRKEKIITSI